MQHERHMHTGRSRKKYRDAAKKHGADARATDATYMHTQEARMKPARKTYIHAHTGSK